MKQFLATRQGQAIVGAVALLVVIGVGGAMAMSGGGSPAADDVEVSTATATVTKTATPPPTPSPTPSPSPTPEPTPPPYNGAIARLYAPELGIDNYIETVHVINNEMQAPDDGVYAVGWYPEYSKPGFGTNSVFSAHETWNRSHGPFYSLHLAKAGDEITVIMDNGLQYHYEVLTAHRYDVDTIPMGEVIWPTTRPAGEEWLTLITCGGRIVYNDTGYGEYLDRDVVQAKLTGKTEPTASNATSATTPALASNR